MSQLEEVHRQMFQSHLSYLAQEDDQRRAALESLAKRYLSLASHPHKLSCPPLGLIFSLQDFCPRAASAACHALEKYATNLLTCPWRPEYRIIKLYSGFFQHVLKRFQPTAVAVLQLLGYRPGNRQALELGEPIEPDRVARIALDCLLARVECQIIIQISEKLQSKATMGEILKVRRLHIGGVEDAVKFLTDRRSSFLDRKSLEMLVDVYDTNDKSDDILYLPPPSQFSGSSTKKSALIRMPEDFRTDGPETWMAAYPGKDKGEKYGMAYPYSGGYPETTHSEVMDHPCQCYHHDIPSPPPPPVLYPHYLCDNFQNLELVPGGKRDSFYDNLSPEDAILLPPPPPCKISLEHQLSSAPSKTTNSVLQSKKRDSDRSSSNSGALKKESCSAPPLVANGTTSDNRKAATTTTGMMTSSNSIAAGIKWPCSFCTYLNKGDVNTCEVCSLGRDTTPLVMGRECPQCTLINHKTAEVCTACDTNLKDSPTYI